jgi:hypothetical protein
MAKFQKINSILDRMDDRLDQLEAQGVDITKLAKPGARNLVADGLRKAAAKLEANRAAATAKAQAEWSVGDAIVTRRGEHGVITAIEGWSLVVEIDGQVRKFAAPMVKAA